MTRLMLFRGIAHLFSTPQRLLMGYAGLLISLGFMLAIADGFSSGWRIIGTNSALLSLIAAAIAHLGTRLEHRRIHVAGAGFGILLCTLGALNFLRLAIKWQPTEFVFALQSIVATCMAAAGLAVAVGIWRNTFRAQHWLCSIQIKRIAAVCGALAIATGLFLSKTVTIPQSASAMLSTTVTVADLIDTITDSNLSDQILQRALDSEQVQQVLIEQGVQPQHIELLAQNPQLRAAAMQMIRTQPEPDAALEMPTLGAMIDADVLPNAASLSAAIPYEQLHSASPTEFLATLSEQDLLQIAQSLNINPQDFADVIGDAKHVDKYALEQNLDNPEVQAVLQQYSTQSGPPQHPPFVAAPTAQPQPQPIRIAAAERIRSQPIETRIATERFTKPAPARANAAHVLQVEPPTRRPPDSVADEVDTPTLTLDIDTLPGGLLDAGAMEAAFNLSTHTAPVDLTTQSTVIAADITETRTASDAGALVDVEELASIIRTARSAYHANAPLPVCAVPDSAQTDLRNGSILSSAGLFVFMIGVAFVLCAVAMGRITPTHPAA